MRFLMSSGNRAFLLVIACGLLVSSCKDDEKRPERQNTAVRTVTAEFTSYSRPVKLTGEVAAHVTTNLSFRVSGKITEWMVDVGERVKKGQVLARIDPKEQNADVESAEAALQGAEAVVKQASLSFERQKMLLGTNASTQELFDQAQTTLQTAQASLESSKAQVGTARDALSYAELRADTDGIVTVRSVETGQVVQTAQTVYTIAKDGPRDAIFNIYESLLSEEPDDPKIVLALVSDPSVQTTGTVSEISPTINASTGTVKVKIAMDSTPDRMTLGASVTGIARPKPAKLLILPWTSVSAINDKPAVWVIDPKSRTADLRPVAIASYETGRVLISGGVSKGEIVVIDGAKSLRPGQVVDVVEEQAL